MSGYVLETKTKREKADMFRKAAVLIENQPKLAKFKYKDADGCLCAVGALATVAGDKFIERGSDYDWRVYPRPEKMSGATQESFGPETAQFLKSKGLRSLEGFNNAASGKEEVAKAFRDIARAIDHGGKFGVR